MPIETEVSGGFDGRRRESWTDSGSWRRLRWGCQNEFGGPDLNSLPGLKVIGGRRIMYPRVRWPVVLVGPSFDEDEPFRSRRHWLREMAMGLSGLAAASTTL